MSPKAEFLVFQKSPTSGPAAYSIKLGRSEFDFRDNRWRQQPIECRMKPVEGKAEMDRLVPVSDLQPGVYVLESFGAKTSFSVSLQGYKGELLNNARRAMANNDSRTALRDAATAFALDPSPEATQIRDEAKFAFSLAEAQRFLDAKQWDAAIQNAQAARALKPDATEAKELLERRIPVERASFQARQALGKNQWDGAVRFADEALSIDASCEVMRMLIEEVPRVPLDGLTDVVRFVQWLPDSEVLVSVSRSGNADMLTLWDTRARRANYTVQSPVPGIVEGMAIVSSDEFMILGRTNPRGLPAYKLAYYHIGRQEAATIDFGESLHKGAFAFCRETGVCAASVLSDACGPGNGFEGGGILLFTHKTLDKTRCLKIGGYRCASVHRVVFTSNGAHIIAANATRSDSFRRDPAGICVVNAESGVILHHVPLSDGSTPGIELSPNDVTIAHWVMGKNSTPVLELVDIKGDHPPRKLVAHNHSISAGSFSGDGHTFASGAIDGEIHLWDVATGQNLGSVKENGAVASMAFSPNKDLLAVGCEQGRLGVWRVSKIVQR